MKHLLYFIKSEYSCRFYNSFSTADCFRFTPAFFMHSFKQCFTLTHSPLMECEDCQTKSTLVSGWIIARYYSGELTLSFCKTSTRDERRQRKTEINRTKKKLCFITLFEGLTLSFYAHLLSLTKLAKTASCGLNSMKLYITSQNNHHGHES